MAAPLDDAAGRDAIARAGALRSPSARRRRWVDRGARWAVSAGGVAVIGSILAILVFLLVEVMPLATASRVDARGTLAVSQPSPTALVVDPDQTHAVTLGADGVVRAIRLADGAVVRETPLLADGEAAPLRALPSAGVPVLAAATADGRIAAMVVDWEVTFDGAVRHVEPRLGDTTTLELDSARRATGVSTVRLDDDGASAAALLADGTVVVARQVETANFMTGAKTRTTERVVLAAPVPPARLLLDHARRTLYGASADGRLLVWEGLEGAPSAPLIAGAPGAAVSALELLIGDRSLVVGREDGSVEIWFRVPRDEAGVRTQQFERVHAFPAQAAAIRLLAPSQRMRSFLAVDADGGLGLYHSTSQRVLWRGASGIADASALAFAPKGNGAALASASSLALFDVDNPHPEASVGAFFGRVWYEGYERPEFVWQSSSGTDDFEPKLSLTPLLVGTLKGTLYSLILAIPLGVLGAMYTSQFMHPRLQRVVKPTVELMASLPSVVLGFLAGLWLAPRVERWLPSLALLLVALPLASIAAGALWSLLPRSLRGRVIPGGEVAWIALCLVLTSALCIALGDPLQRSLFGGSFPTWLFDHFGWRYDQRNAIVVGLAMGFAVIPIIFAISEDAFANVPRNLTAGSLALGATRWQTVVRVVLPTASPGIFSAVMVGFGRAVGETMIVLMATGNTPIMEWSAFNGFRTLSANIAVEIPEAPYGGTLYRTLFLAALLLFALTFAVNTVAELVRQRLRQRYARL
jgi:phosphate transport system permease protein